MSLTYAQIRAFNAVVREGSFTNAAKQLGVSQPAVTAQIKAIEDTYGVRLFERSSKTLTLSDLALALFATTEMVDDVERDAEEILAAYHDLDKGEIRVISAAPRITMELLSEFHERYPSVRIIANFGNGSQVLQAIEKRKADVAILMESPQAERFVSVPFRAHRLMAMVPEHHPLAGRRSIALKDLIGHSVIFRTGASVGQRLLDEALQAQGITIVPSLILETREAVLEGVNCGIGIGFIFEGGSSRANGVKRIPIDDLTTAMVENVFCLEIQSRRRVIEAFLQVARDLSSAGSAPPAAAAS
ncbi:LysR substrate-binding domain-containing protein [Breoghania sp. L-A4]|uniref:LysR substrate-binding domain-containing protein n=1 Tax=Breoghania sp. L-A4 TaxID=2304600 RepID=UPI0013C2BE1D|nr:LysR substrate-binding domain-containing protein [Breoghania sp. L-A4]